MDGKTILLTGGTGSFGQKFVEIALREHHPKAIRVFSRGELLQVQMKERFNNDDRLRFLIGDVRDRNRLHRAMVGVDIVVHAAALKHVPICEYNPMEAVRTNIEGGMNVMDIAIDNGVEKVMLISSDKAVAPVNIYGATKMVAEKLFVQGNAYRGKSLTRLSCVRYGNVAGSRGSIIHILEEQKKKGEITITDARMTRFWLTLDEGVRFVLSALDSMKGGEIFVPKIPSIKVMDLAAAIAPKAKIKFIGIRPGEKLHETLINVDDARHTKEFAGYYIIEPEFSFWGKSDSGGEALPDGFTYASDSNRNWLTIEELKKL